MDAGDLAIIESKDLSTFDKNGVLQEWLPNALKSIENVGGRSQTSYMDTHMVVNERPTLLGKAKQCLSEIASIKAALIANNMDLNDVHVRAAIKRCVNFLEIYKSICAELGVSELTDEMVEAGQREEHVKTMFLQSLRAACSNGGWVDEGDLLYANNVGVSVSECQLEITEFLMEGDKIRSFSMKEQNDWLESMWAKYGV